MRKRRGKIIAGVISITAIMGSGTYVLSHQFLPSNFFHNESTPIEEELSTTEPHNPSAEEVTNLESISHDTSTDSYNGPVSSSTVSQSDNCNLPTGWGRPLSCPAETRSEFTANGGWERVALEAYITSKQFLLDNDTDVTGAATVLSELCMGKVSVSLETLQVIDVEWDDATTSTCDYARNDHPPLPTVEYLNQYLSQIPKS